MERRKIKRKGLKKRIVAGIAAAAVLCTACQGTGNQNRPEDGIVSKEVKDITFPLEKPITITAMVQDFNRDKTQYIDKLLEEKTNVHIEWEIVPISEYETKLAEKIDNGELPDLFQIDMEQMRKVHNKDIFVNYKDYIEQMPNLQEWIQKIPSVYYESVDTAGNMYALNTFNTEKWVTKMPVYRQDIWEKEELPIPKNIDQLYEELLYLKKRYPETVPIANRRGVFELIQGVADLYRTNTKISLDNESEEYEFEPTTERFKSAVNTTRRFYQAGLIDPEFATMSEEQFFKKVISGKVLFMFSEYIEALHTEGNRNWVGKGKLENPDFELLPMEPMLTEYGDTGSVFHRAVNFPMYSVAVNAKSKYINEIMALLDYQLSDEVITLANWGVEGETYETGSQGKRFLIDAGERLEKGIDGRSGMWIPLDISAVQSAMNPIDAEYSRKAGVDMKQYEVYWEKTTLTFSEEEQMKIDSVMEPINAYCEEQYIRFIIGDLNMEEDWEAFQNTLKEMGYEEVLEMYRVKYKNMSKERQGLDK